ncbi:ABC1 kinase family protein [Halobacteriovorax sp.]|uniref:ABC1 kinase family protein n=1 Tax=Halobacteriovorax sp. TaxID=2020862 RepID=UPI003568AE16
MKKISKIKNGLFKRNSVLLKHALKTGANILANKDDPKKIIESIVGVNPDKFIDELSTFKGSVTKAGQLLSQYGEYYLPDNINEKLKKLQSSSHFLDYSQIESQISSKAIEELEIERDPLAAASIGQVHRAKDQNGKSLVLKIQYKGIEKAINGDMFFLKMLMKSLKIFPKGIDTEDIFNELERMLRNEMDYDLEISLMKKYKEANDDDFFYVPSVVDEYCNKKSICMEYIDGVNLGDINPSDFSKDKIDNLGAKIFKLFLKEIFEFNLVQSDAHGGNFLVNEDLTKLYLLDFGACGELTDEVLDFYRNFLRHSFNLDREAFFSEIQRFIKYSNKSLEYDEDIMWEYIVRVSDPLRSDSFDWGNTTLPDDLVEIGKRLRKTLKFKSIPSQFIFIDRKLLGVFALLRQLKASFNVKEVFEDFV